MPETSLAWRELSRFDEGDFLPEVAPELRVIDFVWNQRVERDERVRNQGRENEKETRTRTIARGRMHIDIKSPKEQLAEGEEADVDVSTIS